jgi:protein-L-isoaspartate(D-aspartate) O-methyltransferase
MQKTDSAMELHEQRQGMIRNQLRRRGVTDPGVLAAMEKVPRENFVPKRLREFAYQDSPLPISEGQTISQPFIVARMIEWLALDPGDRVLEIGTGSGYGAAVLSRIAKTVYTVERYPRLAAAAREKLESLGYDNVHVLEGDGSLGWPEFAPYDAILGTAGAPKVPEPLKKQLAVGGRLVFPVGQTPSEQALTLVSKTAEDRFEEREMEGVRFVPLVGEAGWR